MVFVITNKNLIKHLVYVEVHEDYLEVHIVRQAPMISSIKLNLEKDASYIEIMGKIQRVVELDHEMFEFMKEHLRDD